MNKTPFAFTQKQVEFLNSYRPENDFVTSIEEYELIVDTLNLAQLSLYSLTECRNAVVRFYSDKRKTDYVNDYMTPMMSVTAAIDHFSLGYTA